MTYSKRARQAKNRCQRNHQTRGENVSSTLRTLAALAMLALISAGCGNAAAGPGSSGGNNTATTAPAQTGSGSSGGNTATATNRDQAVKFAECMRKNGVRE